MKKLKIAGMVTGVTTLLLPLIPVGVAGALSGPITNGSFETGTDPGAYTTLSAGDNTSIPGWKVTSGTVDYIGTYWQAADGSRSIDLSGNGPGAISQTFHTSPGKAYFVSFELAGNPDGGTGTRTVNVDTGSSPTPYTFTVGSNTTASMGWATENYGFTATGNNTTLTFTSAESNPYGPALDNVAVQPVNDDFSNNLNPTACGVTKHTKEVVDVNFKLTNDYDSAVGGNAWANDTINRELQIWNTSGNTYCALVKDDGNIVTFNGNSPNGSGTVGAGIKGTMDGGYRTVQFTGTFAGKANYKTHGNLGTFSLGCGPSTAPGYDSTCTGPHPSFASYFSNDVSNTDYAWWGWEYSTCQNGYWVNSIDGDFGDITGNAPSKNSRDCGCPKAYLNSLNHCNHDSKKHCGVRV